MTTTQARVRRPRPPRVSAARLLAAAGDGARLVGRPHGGVVHAYNGPMTPSGRYVPRTARTVCGTHTSRLVTVREPRLACARCAARLLPEGVWPHPPDESGRAVPGPGTEPVWNLLGSGTVTRHQSRGDWAAAFDGLTLFDLAVDAFMARTPTEVDRVEFLAVLLHGHRAVLDQPLTSPAGKQTPPLVVHLSRARHRVRGDRKDPAEVARQRAVEETTRRRRKQAAHEAWEEREAGIARLGFSLADTRRLT